MNSTIQLKTFVELDHLFPPEYNFASKTKDARVSYREAAHHERFQIRPYNSSVPHFTNKPVLLIY